MQVAFLEREQCVKRATTGEKEGEAEEDGGGGGGGN